MWALRNEDDDAETKRAFCEFGQSLWAFIGFFFVLRLGGDDASIKMRLTCFHILSFVLWLVNWLLR